MIPECDYSIISIAETTEGLDGIELSFLASDEALSLFAQIMEMSPEEAQEALEDLESQKAVI